MTYCLNVKNESQFTNHESLISKAAFTLAEVLITLGIIGVVAAMTIPNLITSHNKRTTVTKLQKAISIINQAYKLSFDELGEPGYDSAFEMGSEEYFKTYWAPFLRVETYCSTAIQCGYSIGRFKDLQGAYKWSFDGSKTQTVFYTSDGIIYVIPIKEGTGAAASSTGRVIVDINGGTGPNMYGRDVFHLYRKDDGSAIVPVCDDYNNVRMNRSCSKTGDGICCAEKIRRTGWQIDTSYPWR